VRGGHQPADNGDHGTQQQDGEAVYGDFLAV
jgi:hypothetical protein